MTSPMEEFVRLTQRTQEALTAAVQAWERAARSAAGSAQPAGGSLPDVRATVDAALTFATRVLNDQLEFATALVSWASANRDADEADAVEAARPKSARTAPSIAPSAVPGPTAASAPSKRPGTKRAPAKPAPPKAAAKPAPPKSAAEPASKAATKAAHKSATKRTSEVTEAPAGSTGTRRTARKTGKSAV